MKSFELSLRSSYHVLVSLLFFIAPRRLGSGMRVNVSRSTPWHLPRRLSLLLAMEKRRTQYLGLQGPKGSHPSVKSHCNLPTVSCLCRIACMTKTPPVILLRTHLSDPRSASACKLKAHCCVPSKQRDFTLTWKLGLQLSGCYIMESMLSVGCSFDYIALRRVLLGA